MTKNGFFYTREAWLRRAAYLLLRGIISDAAKATPKWVDRKYLDVTDERQVPHVSIGWPKTRGRGANAIGQAWSESLSGDDKGHIFISPEITDSVRALDILLHELIHLVVGNKHGHRGQFKVAAIACGLTGQMTATVAGPELKAKLEALAKQIDTEVGSWSNAGLKPVAMGSGAARPGSPLLKIQCMECGCLLRMTLKWIDKVGLPTCGCGGEMVLRH